MKPAGKTACGTGGCESIAMVMSNVCGGNELLVVLTSEYANSFFSSLHLIYRIDDAAEEDTRRNSQGVRSSALPWQYYRV